MSSPVTPLRLTPFLSQEDIESGQLDGSCTLVMIDVQLFTDERIFRWMGGVQRLASRGRQLLHVRCLLEQVARILIHGRSIERLSTWMSMIVQCASDAHALRFMAAAVLGELLISIAFSPGTLRRFFSAAETTTHQLVRTYIFTIVKQLARLDPASAVLGIRSFEMEPTFELMLMKPGLFTRVSGSCRVETVLQGTTNGIRTRVAKIWNAELAKLQHAYARSASLVLESRLPTVLAQHIASFIGGQPARDIPSQRAWRHKLNGMD